MNREPSEGPGFVVATWNVEWASPLSRRGKVIRECLTASKADVICVTEGFAENLPAGGQIIEAHPDYGYPLREGRRKVLLWTRHRWRDVDAFGNEHLPPGRFVAGTLDCDGASIQILGVCIPWPAAHVSSGRRDRARWEDHLLYLRALGDDLRRRPAMPTIVLGDFNQAIPRVRQRLDVAEALRTEVLELDLQALSAHMRAEDGLPFIDHIVVSRHIEGEILR